MRTLAELRSQPEGRDFLRRRGVFLDLEEFLGQLPAKAHCPSLSRLGLGSESAQSPPEQRLIWAGQQLYVDYKRSVTSKIRALQECHTRPELSPVFVCADTDRSGSEKAITTIQWPLPQGPGTIAVTRVKAARNKESRFVESDPKRRREASDKLKAYLKQSLPEPDYQRSLARYNLLREVFENPSVATLSDLNFATTRLLLEGLGLSVPTRRLSSFLEAGCLDRGINRWLNKRQACIAAFNEAIEDLKAQDIDPVARPLADDYLPLNFSCPKDGTRFRLRYEQRGGESFAVGQSRSGERYRFSLGQGSLDFEEIKQTKRWSPDISLPIFLNPIVSGCVVGKSSALYGLVLNQVLERALEERPVPMFVPELEAPVQAHDSALHDFLTQAP